MATPRPAGGPGDRGRGGRRRLRRRKPDPVPRRLGWAVGPRRRAPADRPDSRPRSPGPSCAIRGRDCRRSGCSSSVAPNCSGSATAAIAWRTAAAWRARSAMIVVAAWWWIALASLAAWLPFAWGRYALPLLPPTVLLLAEALVAAARGGGETRDRVASPQPSLSCVRWSPVGMHRRGRSSGLLATPGGVYDGEPRDEDGGAGSPPRRRSPSPALRAAAPGGEESETRGRDDGRSTRRRPRGRPLGAGALRPARAGGEAGGRGGDGGDAQEPVQGLLGRVRRAPPVRAGGRDPPHRLAGVRQERPLLRQGI